MTKRIFIALLPFIATGALAQDLAQDEAAEVRRYTVEMIIFAYAQSVSAGTEVFVPDPPPAEELAFDDVLGVPADEEVAAEITAAVETTMRNDEAALEAERRYEITMLLEEDFKLIDAYERLERLDAYEPLLHFGWTQPTYPDEQTEARPLSSFVTPPVGLDGDLNLYLSRYLHLAINLQLQEPPPVETGDYDDLELLRPVYYRISEDRIFRNGDLRYFDHPKFGVLAKITRVEEESPIEEAAPQDGELLGYD